VIGHFSQNQNLIYMVTCDVTIRRVLIWMIGFIRTWVTSPLGHTQSSRYHYSTHFTITPH
jgi:hypothetical protein